MLRVDAEEEEEKIKSKKFKRKKKYEICKENKYEFMMSFSNSKIYKKFKRF